MARITVLMPVYNGMPYIPQAVESVLSQSETDWELIISDNGSTDGTRDYLRTLTDPRIRVHYQDSNLGIFGNLNFLLAQSRSDIAKILCADDELLPDALTRIAAFMEERPWCAVSRCWRLGDSRRFGPGGTYEAEGRLPASLNPKAAYLAYLTFGNPVGNLSQAAIRPRLVLECGGFDPTLPHSGDREAWARVVHVYGLELNNDELVYERIHPHQNRLLLNIKNENLAQITRYLEKWATNADIDDLAILKKHWIIHFLAPRVPGLFQQAMHGHFQLAANGLKELPFGISPLTLICAYPVWKLNLPPARRTTKQLFDRILELNTAPDQRVSLVRQTAVNNSSQGAL